MAQQGTQGPWGVGKPVYASFAGKVASTSIPRTGLGPFSTQGPWAVGKPLYSSFAGKTAGVPAADNYIFRYRRRRR